MYPYIVQGNLTVYLYLKLYLYVIYEPHGMITMNQWANLKKSQNRKYDEYLSNIGSSKNFINMKTIKLIIEEK